MKIGNALQKWVNGSFSEQLVIDVWSDKNGKTTYYNYCALAKKYEIQPVSRKLFHKICKDLQRQYELSVKAISKFENQQIRTEKHEFCSSRI